MSALAIEVARAVRAIEQAPEAHYRRGARDTEKRLAAQWAAERDALERYYAREMRLAFWVLLPVGALSGGLFVAAWCFFA